MASRGVNKVILIGNLGNDPEVRYMPNGKAVANISIATSESWKDQSGQIQERTEWHRCVSYGRLAEVIGEYLRKGSKIYVEGRLATREWQDQQGQKRYTTEIVISEMQMLDGRPADSNSSGHHNQPARHNHPGSQGQGQAQGQWQGQEQGNANGYPQVGGQPQYGGYANARNQPIGNPQGMPNSGGYTEPGMDFDDDIPF